MSSINQRIINLSPEKRRILELVIESKKKDIKRESITQRSRQGTIPLSFAQKRLWFLHQLDPNSHAYVLATAISFKGTLNIKVLEQTLSEIVRRHEALRTVFSIHNEEPVQIILPPEPTVLECTTLKYESDIDGYIDKILHEESVRPFDLSQGPLLRTNLLKISEEYHTLFLSMHHIACDGASLQLLAYEIAVLYRAFSTGNSSPLPKLPIQYADFAIWQREWLQGEEMERQLTYWKRRLAGAPPIIDLPLDKPRPPINRFVGAQHTIRLSEETSNRLKALSLSENATLFMTMLAAFKVLLFRYTRQKDIVVGVPIAGRNRSEVENLIGFFVNTLVMRTELSGEPSFREVLCKVRDAALGAYNHQDLPFEKLVDELQPERDASHSPLFQVMFILQEKSTSKLNIPELDLSIRRLRKESAKFDMRLLVQDLGSRLQLALNYNTDLFHRSTIVRILKNFECLLESIVANPDEHIALVPLLSEQEQHLLNTEWNQTVVPYPKDICLHQLIELQASLTPDQDALIFEGIRISYRDLNNRANQLANHLQRLGVGPETLVGIAIDRSIEMVIGLLGILKAGAAYVPFDPTYPLERISYMIEDSQIRVLLTEKRLVESLPKHDAYTICLDSDWEVIACESVIAPTVNVSPDNAAYMIYTSGSTGKPKGAINTHKAICNRLLWMQDAYKLRSDDRVLQKTPFSFDVSVWEFFWPLITGACLVVARPGGHQDSSYLARLILEEGITTLHFVPSMLRLFLEEPNLEACTSLKRVICSGEALTLELQEKFFDRLNIELHNLYGPTEAAVDVTYWKCEKEVSLQSVPIGRPIANTEIYILDQYLNSVPVGVAGELYIGGVGLARGYFNRPELTAEKFIPNPYSPSLGERLYRTGDLARFLEDGNIEFLGRIDHQIKIRGFRIELGEIEAVLSSHPDIKDVVVVAREEDLDSKRLVAYIVANPNRDLKISELRVYVSKHLPDYMLPSTFVSLSSVPLSPNGKVDRKALPIPDNARPDLSRPFVAPRNELEHLLAAMWQKILGIEKIGIYDNFFELGGDSIKGAVFINKLQQHLKESIQVVVIFESPTIAELAEYIKSNYSQPTFKTYSTITPVPRDADRTLPLSFAQERLWFLDQFEPNSSFYNVPAAIRLTGQLNIEALEYAFNEIIERHESLRTTFPTLEGEPIQIIWPAEPISLPIEDISDLAEQEIKIRQIAEEVSRKPFDLSQRPLMRASLLRLGIEDHVLLLTMHHIISDGWSIGILIRETLELYDAFISNRPAILPSLPVQYADYAIWQRDSLQGEVLNKQLDYWKRELAGAPPVLSLPTDRPRLSNHSFRGASQSILIPTGLTRRLKEICAKEDVTLFMLLLAAFKTLLARYTMQEDMVIGTPIAGRNRAEIEGLIGFFVNTLVIRTDLSGYPTFHELLERVRNAVLGAFSNQDVPFEKLVEELRPDRDLSYTPLFQVMFALQNATREELSLSGLKLKNLKAGNKAAKFDLTLSVAEDTEGLTASFEYNTDLFDATTIARIAKQFSTLLEAIATNPNQQISTLSILPHEEQNQILIDWNSTKFDYPALRIIHRLFEAQVEKTPTALALVFEENSITYEDLNRRANQLASYLRKLGIGPDCRVGLYMERSLELMIGLLGILKTGAAYVPIDPSYPMDRIAFMVEDSRIEVMLTQSTLLRAISECTNRTICLDTEWNNISLHSSENLSIEVNPSNLAYVIYTSGSTGRPKGVAISHQNLVSSTYARMLYYKEPVKSFLLLPSFAFDSSIAGIFWSICQGGKIVLPAEGLQRDSQHLAELIKKHHVSHLLGLPSLYDLLLTQEEQESLKSLETVIVAGESCSKDIVRRHKQECNWIKLFNEYGPTEGTVWSTVYECSSEEREIVPIGRPISNTQIYLLDKSLQPVPIGAIGEIFIGGDNLARCYLNQPELTAEKFIPNPFNNLKGERLYRTGDIARYLSDGNIEFLGRIDNQVKIRGFRIEVEEIESVIKGHTLIKDAAVIIIGDTPLNKRIAAYVVSSTESNELRTEIRKYLKQKLPDYMVPAIIVTLESLPLTPNGKVDRGSLPLPEASTTLDANEELVSIGRPTQEIITGIWSRVLGVKRVGIHENFFDLGGHSLLGTQVISHIRTTFKVNLPLRTLFEAPTIAELSREVERSIQNRLENEDLPLKPISRAIDLPLSFAQHRLWFIDQIEPGSFAYNIPSVVRLTGKLNIEALQKSLNEIVRRHELLRTSFKLGKDGPIQVISPFEEVSIRFIDLSHLHADLSEKEILQYANKEMQQPFNLSQSPLLRASLLSLGKEEHVLVLIMHHIISDAWSMGVFIKETATLYKDFLNGSTPSLPALTIQYADYAYWQRDWLQGQVLEKQIDYWTRTLGKDLPLLNLPTDKPRPTVQTFKGASYTFKLSKALTEAVKELSRQQDVTLFMLLLATFQVQLSRYTKQEDIVVGTDIANRNREETERLIGFFINHLILRTNLAGDPSFVELLERVRESTLGAYAHQDLPFDKLVSILKPERALSHTPLFQVLFVLQNAPMPPLQLADLSLSLINISNSTSKFDIGLFVMETEQGLAMNWRYKTDLFHNETIISMANHFAVLIESIVSKPETKISKLEMITKTEREKQLAEEIKQKDLKLQNLKASRRKAVVISKESLTKKGYLSSSQTFPLVIEPTLTGVNLSDWASNNQSYIEDELLKHGAILFRGFDVKAVSEFEKFASSICPELFDEYGDLPREEMGGKVYSSTPFPSDKTILFHNESSHLHCWPMKIWFYCVKAAREGGETPIVDCRKAYRLLSAKTRDKFAQKRLLYTRNYIEGIDVSWQDFFQTRDKHVVEAYCKRAGISFEWKHGDSLRTERICQAIVRHPKTAEPVFFNQVQLHHISCLDHNVQASLISLFKDKDLPRNVYYGDGSPIEQSVMEEICEVYQQSKMEFPWQEGDILMLDNMLIAHGRNPFIGPRKIVVAMGEIINSIDIQNG